MTAIGTMAVIFDFDDTLTDDSTSKLITKHGLDAKKFWEKDAHRLVVTEGWEPTFAWVHLLLKYMEERKLPAYTCEQLRQFGGSLKPYPGLGGLLKDLRKIAGRESFDIEFYIISGGIQDIVEGFRLRPEFTAVWGTQLAPATPGGPVKYLKRAITFTEKTRYLFEINKGIKPADAAKNPSLVNKDVPMDKRPVPFANMLYVGDGLSDIPCFSVIEKRPEGDRGKAFGVFQPGDEKSARRAWLELIFPHRATGGVHAPKYGSRQALGSLLRMAVSTRCADIKLRKA